MHKLDSTLAAFKEKQTFVVQLVLSCKDGASSTGIGQSAWKGFIQLVHFTVMLYSSSGVV